MMNLDELTGIESITRRDDGTADVTVRGGMRLRDLNAALEEEGLALINLGATAAQSIAGATATGTHGTGRELGSMSTQIVGMRIVDGQGQLHTIDETSEVPLSLDMARVSLGVLGVVTSVTVRAVPLFKLKKTSITMPLSELLERHDELYETYPRMQFMYVGCAWRVWGGGGRARGEARHER